MLKKDNYTNSSERHHELMVKNGGIGWMWSNFAHQSTEPRGLVKVHEKNNKVIEIKRLTIKNEPCLLLMKFKVLNLYICQLWCNFKMENKNKHLNVLEFYKVWRLTAKKANCVKKIQMVSPQPTGSETAIPKYTNRDELEN